MGVVFDEVIATVEAPTSAPQEMEVSEQLSQEGGEHEEQIIQIIEKQQRKAKRLRAD